jgi:hypothetical protein
VLRRRDVIAVKQGASIMKRMFSVLALGLLCVSQQSYAGSVSNATITSVAIFQQIGDLMFVSTNQAVNSPPSCSNNAGFTFVVSLSTAVGQQTMAVLLAARSAQASVTISGSGACDLYSNVETLVNVTY